MKESIGEKQFSRSLNTMDFCSNKDCPFQSVKMFGFILDLLAKVFIIKNSIEPKNAWPELPSVSEGKGFIYNVTESLQKVLVNG